MKDLGKRKLQDIRSVSSIAESLGVGVFFILALAALMANFKLVAGSGAEQALMRRGIEASEAQNNGAEGNEPKKSGGAEGNGLERPRKKRKNNFHIQPENHELANKNDGAEGNGPALPRQLKLNPDIGIVASVEEILKAKQNNFGLREFLNGDAKLLVKENSSNRSLLDVYFVNADVGTYNEGKIFSRIMGEVYYASLDLNLFNKTSVKLLHAGMAVISFNKLSKSVNRLSWHLAWAQNLTQNLTQNLIVGLDQQAIFQKLNI